MKLSMRESFDQLFPYFASKNATTARDEAASSLATLHQAMEAGEYAKHCLSYIAGVKSQECRVQELEVELSEAMHIIDRLRKSHQEKTK